MEPDRQCRQDSALDTPKEKTTVEERRIDARRMDDAIGSGSVDMYADPSKKAGADGERAAAEKKVVRKLDICLVPILGLMFMMNLLDRKAVTLAPLDGMNEGLHLNSVQFSTGISVFYVGYILGQVPSNMIITRVSPSRWLAGSMVSWSVVATLTCLVRNFRGLVLCRFFLGLTQAPFAAGAFFLLSSFYTRRELSIRFAWMVLGAVLGSNFSSLIAFGTFSMRGLAGLDGWRWLFLILGVITAVVAITAAFVLPDSPESARWLTPAERQLAEDRMRRDTAGARGRTTTWTGLVDAVRDPHVWLFVFVKHMGNAEGGFRNFLPLIIKSFGFGKTATFVLMCGPGFLGGVADVVCSYSSSHLGERVWHVTGLKAAALAGFVAFCITLNPVARYVLIVVMAVGGTGPAGIINGWFPGVVGQTREKRAAALAVINAISSSADIWTPYLFPSSDAPRYAIGMSVGAVATLLCVAGTWAVRHCLARANRRLRERDDYDGALYPL